MSDTAHTTDVDPRLLEILVCPVTRGLLEYDRARAELVSRGTVLVGPMDRAGLERLLTRPEPAIRQRLDGRGEGDDAHQHRCRVPHAQGRCAWRIVRHAGDPRRA